MSGFDGNSLEDDIDNEFCPIIAYLDIDKNEYITDNDITNNILVAFRKAETNKLKIYIDDFPDEKCESEFDNDMIAFKEYSIEHLTSCNEYSFTGETFEYDGQNYYLWELTISDQENYNSVYYLLTSTLDFSDSTLEDDIYSDYNPVICYLNEDMEITYDNTDGSDDLVNSKYIVAVRNIMSAVQSSYLCTLFNINNDYIKNIEIDGKTLIDGQQIEQSGKQLFDKPGIHTVKFNFYDNTCIESHMFENCTDIISIKIPENFIDINNYAFSNCYNL